MSAALAIMGWSTGAMAQNGGAGGAPPKQPEPLASIVAPEIAIPANGAILIESREGQPIVRVSREGMLFALAGTVRQASPESDAFWAWVPDEPIAPLGRYDVRISFDVEPQPVIGTVEVIDAIDLEEVPAPLPPRLEWSGRVAGTGTCVYWDGAQVRPNFGEDFTTWERGTVEMTSGIDPAASAELVHQFLFASSFNTYAPGDYSWALAGRFEEQQESYCSTYKAISISTGMVHEVELCVPHGDLPPLDTREVTVPDSALERARCEGPPAGLEARWCMINEACAALTDGAAIAADHCGLYGPVCRNECLPGGVSIASVMLPVGGCGGPSVSAPWGGAGQSGVSNAGPCIDMEDEEADDDAAEDGSPEEPEDGASNAVKRGGCGCSAIGSPHTPRAWLAVPALVLLLGRAVRKMRRRGGTRS